MGKSEIIGDAGNSAQTKYNVQKYIFMDTLKISYLGEKHNEIKYFIL